MPNFSLYQERIFRKLREGTAEVDREEFFFTAIEQHANRIAARCNSKVEVSPTRVWEAQKLWDHDMTALISEGKIDSSPYPCEFKHAAFLCFWLRRRVIVETVQPIDPTIGVTNTDYMDYKNEYIAFYTALHLVLYHVYFPKGGDDVADDAFTNYSFPADLAHEALVMLHHKNVSPHALYLMFKFLLAPMHPPAGPPRPKVTSA